MGWRRAIHQCHRPPFWSLRAVGRVWDCPECKAAWIVRRGAVGRKTFVLLKAGVR